MKGKKTKIKETQVLNLNLNALSLFLECITSLSYPKDIEEKINELALYVDKRTYKYSIHGLDCVGEKVLLTKYYE